MRKKSVRRACFVCGYDQTGMIASWKDSCPLRGACSECGAMIEWSELFRPELYEQKRFSEHPEARFPRDCVRTVWKALLPMHFWSWAPRSQEVRAGRLLGATAVGLLLWFVVPIVIGILLLGAYAWLFVQPISHGYYNMTKFDWYIISVMYLAQGGAVWIVQFHVLALIVAGCWAILARRRRVRSSQILRGWCYITVVLGAIGGVWHVLKAVSLVLPYNTMSSGLVSNKWDFLHYFSFALWFFFAAWYWHSWACFMSRYLKAVRPRLTVALYGVVTALLYAVLTITLIDPYAF